MNNCSIRGIQSTDKTEWDEDDSHKVPVRKSSWDFPTPKVYSQREESVRSDRYKYEMKSSRKSHKDYKGKPYEDTPRATPAYKYF